MLLLLTFPQRNDTIWLEYSNHIRIGEMKMRLLIYGAGVIGCLYAALFAEAGNDVTLLARGKRLDSLAENGLRYRSGNSIKTAGVKIIERLDDNNCYDFVFVTVREHQLYGVLEALKSNVSPNIVTMVNSLDTYDNWERICGAGRIIPAFPGAGGGFDGDILNAALTPAIVQPTTFAEPDGSRSERIGALAEMFRRAHIPYQVVPDMHSWQLCHLAMVVPIADAYYEAAIPENTGSDTELMTKTAKRIKRNLSMLKRSGVQLSPPKMNMFLMLPIRELVAGLSCVFKSDFGDKFMYRHSMKAPDEMRDLHIKFYGYLKRLNIK